VTIQQEQHEPITMPIVGADGDACRYCGASLAADQRWCLNCGRRRSEVRPPFEQPAQSPAEPVAATRAPVVIAGRPVSSLAIGSGIAVFAVALLIGVLIGNAGDEPKQVAAATPQVIRVTVPGAAAAPAQPASFTSDWPAGKDGFTIQLETLPKDGAQAAQVDAAKADAEAKGATDVGALDSDDFSSLDPGNYVVYAGVFDARKQARKALGDIKADFPGARVVKVSAGGGLASQGDPDALSGKKKSATVGKEQLEDLKKLSPEKYQKKSSKLPDETKLPGKAPPKDDKPAGGGEGGGETIG
jgi:hypothetical protein